MKLTLAFFALVAVGIICAAVLALPFFTPVTDAYSQWLAELERDNARPAE